MFNFMSATKNGKLLYNSYFERPVSICTLNTISGGRVVTVSKESNVFPRFCDFKASSISSTRRLKMSSNGTVAL